MIGEEKWPEVEHITFATPEDAKRMAKVLNEIYGQLEGMWEHIRALEFEMGRFNNLID